MIDLSIDGRPAKAPAGATLLQAMRACGVDVPALCHDDRLRPAGDCRMCLVEIEGAPHPVPACATRVAAGMQARTATPALLHFRETMLGWMAAKASPGDLARHPDKPLHKALREAGVAPTAPESGDEACDLSHPLIRVDMSRCIDCLRCVRICEEVQGQSVWHAVDRGEATRIVPDSGSTLGASSCVGCGACVDTCPTAALTDRDPPGDPAAVRWTRTVCAYCGVGCEIEAGAGDGVVVAVRPARDAPVNRGHLCVKGRYAFQFARSPQRIVHPMVRDGRATPWRRASWDEALDRVADGLRRIVAAHGPQAVGVLASARATNEDAFVAQKFARVVLGTHNVDSCARVCHTPTAAAMKAMLGAGAATNSFDDIERAATLLVVGANPLECHPVVGARIRRRARAGAALIVIDPRRTELAAVATLHLAPRPGTDIPLLNAMAHVALAEGLANEGFLAARADGVDAFRRFVEAWTPERAAAICGVPAEAIREAARLYARGAPAMCFHGLGLTEHVQGVEGVMALVDLALLTGNVGKPGAGVNPLRGQNNVQGAAHMGCDPSILTGSASIPSRRALFEREWAAPLSETRGLHLLGMIDAAARGELKALWVVGYDVYLTLAQEAATRRAMEKVELVVVQDLFETETARAFGDVFLPATSAFEKDGTFMNAERRVQRVRPAAPAPGEARDDWRIMAEVARRMGCAESFAYGSAAEIWDEVRRVWPEGAGMSYERLARGGLQWPCLDEADPGASVLHVEGFAHAPRAALRRIDYLPTPETPSDEFPFLLTTGRVLAQFNAGTMTGRSAVAALRPTDTLDLCAHDAARLGLGDGDAVRVRSRYGEAVLPARIDAALKPGEAFASFHDASRFLNRITGPHRDRIVQAPEYKITAVALERA